MFYQVKTAADELQMSASIISNILFLAQTKHSAHEIVPPDSELKQTPHVAHCKLKT